MITRRSVAAACIAGTLVLPTAASAMPIDNGRPAPPQTIDTPPPTARTIVQNTDDTLAIALAGAALVVALSSAGYSALRLAPLGAARGDTAT
jgi:precorrin-4 methylase